MTVDGFRLLALSFAGAEEHSHMNHPDFRANGRIFATLGYPSPSHGCLMLTPEHQAIWMEAAAQVFSLAAGAWGRAGATIILLEPGDAEMLGAAMTQAWQHALARKPPVKRKPSAKKRSA